MEQEVCLPVEWLREGRGMAHCERQQRRESPTKILGAAEASLSPFVETVTQASYGQLEDVSQTVPFFSAPTNHKTSC